jgi:hypothetical protein
MWNRQCISMQILSGILSMLLNSNINTLYRQKRQWSFVWRLIQTMEFQLHCTLHHQGLYSGQVQAILNSSCCLVLSRAAQSLFWLRHERMTRIPPPVVRNISLPLRIQFRWGIRFVYSRVSTPPRRLSPRPHFKIYIYLNYIRKDIYCTTVLVVRYITSCDFYTCRAWRST